MAPMTVPCSAAAVDYYRKLHGPQVLLQVRQGAAGPCDGCCRGSVTRWTVVTLGLCPCAITPPPVTAPGRSPLQLNIAYYLPSIPLLVVSAFLDKPLEERLGGCWGLGARAAVERCRDGLCLAAAGGGACTCCCRGQQGPAPIAGLQVPLPCLLACRRGPHHPDPPAAGPGWLWIRVRLVPLHARGGPAAAPFRAGLSVLTANQVPRPCLTRGLCLLCSQAVLPAWLAEMVANRQHPLPPRSASGSCWVPPSPWACSAASPSPHPTSWQVAAAARLLPLVPCLALPGMSQCSSAANILSAATASHQLVERCCQACPADSRSCAKHNHHTTSTPCSMQVARFANKNVIALGLGCSASGPLVLALQLALRMGPEPTRRQQVRWDGLRCGVKRGTQGRNVA